MTLLVTVLGVVQGVGYRPFVANLAKELEISGFVRNSGGIVQILAKGSNSDVAAFVQALSRRKPPGATVDQVLTETVSDDENCAGFQIIESTETIEYTPLLPTDLPMCEKCREELSDSGNRRFGYSFISCVDCGPRYSIMESIPYDRKSITMNSFPMCPKCSEEYTGDDRRRHAQTISCHDCGPQLILSLPSGEFYKEEALSRSIAILTAGKVLAIKGIGGYQLAGRPDLPSAVDALRNFKNRDRKPFAVMFPNLDAIKSICDVQKKEEELLLSQARPIVLLAADRPETPAICAQVTAGSCSLGAFLPYTALHQQLMEACGPLIMTSANQSGEPIFFKDEDILRLTSPYISGVLYNTRRIVTPLDDSVSRVACDRPQVIRRSRGYVPSAITLADETTHTILALGSDLKSSFCLYKKNRAYMSQYFGDMERYAVRKNYVENIKHMKSLFSAYPDIIACDLHPSYSTNAIAYEMAANLREPILIQHHHAHAASVMAEQKIDSCIAVTFDGTGYGTDGAVWGGEFLLCREAGYTREAHLSYVNLCGGDEGARHADLTESCYVTAIGEKIDRADSSLILAALLDQTLSHRSSSMGRLFDAVSSVLGVCKENSYEGECAIMLENAAFAARKEGILPYSLHFPVAHGKDGRKADQTAVFHSIYHAAKSGIDKKAIALGFHGAITELVVTLCRDIMERSKETRVVLSGGVFANRLLTEDCFAQLTKNGFSVYINESVPTNDGGISLGQAWICGQILKTR
jgi:hydrogenase maturation protein HypF